MTQARMKKLSSTTTLYAILLLVTIAALGPTAWVMASSFKSSNQIFAGSNVLVPPYTVQGYIDAFTEVHLHRFLINSAIYAGGGTLGAVLAALLSAYPLTRFQFRGRNTLVAAFALALAIPVVGLATPEFFIVRELGLFDSKVGLTIFYSALLFPLCFVILRAFLTGLPVEIEDAASIDGAGYFTILFRIVLPLSRPAIATVAVVAFVTIWNEFFCANLLVVSLENQNVQLALAAFKSQFRFNVSGALAGATVIMIVPITAFLLLQRQVIDGLTSGATK